MKERVCKICNTTEDVVGVHIRQKVFVGFFCRRHTDMIAQTTRLGATLAGRVFKAYLAWKHPKILAVIEQTVQAVAAPAGEYERVDVA